MPILVVQHRNKYCLHLTTHLAGIFNSCATSVLKHTSITNDVHLGYFENSRQLPIDLRFGKSIANYVTYHYFSGNSKSVEFRAELQYNCSLNSANTYRMVWATSLGPGRLVGEVMTGKSRWCKLYITRHSYKHYGYSIGQNFAQMLFTTTAFDTRTSLGLAVHQGWPKPNYDLKWRLCW